MGQQFYRAYLKALPDEAPQPVEKADEVSEQETPWRKIVALADSLRQKGTRRLTPEQAVDRVLQTAEGKALYQEYMAAKPRR